MAGCVHQACLARTASASLALNVSRQGGRGSMRLGLCARSTRLLVADGARYRHGILPVQSVSAGTVQTEVRVG